MLRPTDPASKATWCSPPPNYFRLVGNGLSFPLSGANNDLLSERPTPQSVCHFKDTADDLRVDPCSLLAAANASAKNRACAAVHPGQR
jgi:hypothetical protein